ncbi:MAG TPA: hypothetical protein GX727_07460 [Clostridium sp.]|nr:hypothetical protein [Clostridium sp.]
MNQTKMNLLEDTFGNSFNIDSFRRFTREFFNEAEMLSESRRIGIPREYNDHINAYYTLAKYEDSEANNIIVLAVELKRHTSIDRARSMQRNFISKILDDEGLEAAIVAFYTEGEPSWRLSFVRLDYTLTEKGPDIDLTPARRYSYLVGKNEPNHTARAQLLPIFQDDKHNPSLDEIEGAFSVEKVTRDFFTVYKEKYLDLKEYLETNTAFIEETKSLGFEVDKFAEQFAKKLMGQLAFLYFLQKKGWLGVRIVPKEITKGDLTLVYNSVNKVKKDMLEKVYTKIDENTYALNIELISSKDFTDHEAEILSDIFKSNDKFDRPWGSGSRQFIRKILWEHCERNNKNFFNDYLEPFFYDALNKKRKNHYFKSFNSKIPFLNGGLFEPIEGYHWKDINFQIPNHIFSNKKEKNRKADGILDIFDRFNFTINEAEPLEKDIAVDPEMLGRIFEELLEVSDRKSKGAFYTPREIVHYMCQESLINHLVNEVGVPYEDMKEFILYGELIRDADNRRNVGYGKGFTIKESILNNISEIDDALRDVRVADPAVGSGAFPLGMLNEIVKARNNITEYIIRKDKEGAFGEKYGEEFIRNWRSPYQMKLDTIKDSIFAVDIEPSAIDITKLRLWLSIVVDQEIDGINIEPNPLPNLDMNIHVGNSLIDEYEGIKLFDKSILEKKKKNEKKKNQKIEQMRLFFDSEEILNEMFEKQSQYFAEVDEGNKEFLKLRIDELRDQLINQRLREAGNTEAIEKYKEIKKEKTKPYFIWELEFAKVFKEKGGFDIVIGNPPYVGESGNKDIFRPIAETEFGKKHYLGKMDLFYFFFHIALDIGNENSEISFITTNYYPTAFGAKRLRLDLKERSYIRKLIDFNELKIFDSARGQHNMITILTKRKDEDIIAETCLTSRTGDADSKILNAITSWEDKQSKYNNLNQDNIYEGEENYIRLNGVLGSTVNSIESVIGKLSKLEVRLGDIAEINQGVVTGCDYISGRNINKITDKSNIEKNDGIFVLDMLNKRDSKKLNDFNEGVELLRDFYKNSDIERYWCKTYPEKKIIYYPDKLDGNKYPDILEHLLPYKEILESRLKTYNEKYHWTAIHRPRSERIFNECKIVVPYRAKKNNFAYNDVEWFCRSDVYVITQKDPKYNLKYLLALLNSKPYYTWLYYKGKRKGETLELFQVPLSEIPIKNVNQNTQNKIISIVDDILDITIQEDYLRNLEKHNKVSEYAREIDQIVYDLYNFTEEEIKLIEEHYGEE